MTRVTDKIREAWRRYVQDVTDPEIDACLYVMSVYRVPTVRLIMAYRAGRRADADRLAEAEHYESMLVEHVPHDMWRTLGIYPWRAK